MRIFWLAVLSGIALLFIGLYILRPQTIHESLTPQTVRPHKTRTTSAALSLGSEWAADSGVLNADEVAKDPRFQRDPQPFGPEATALSGLQYRALGSSGLKERGVPERFKFGVEVENIHPRSPAAEAHLEVGDVILTADKQLLTDEAALAKLIGDREHTMISFSRKGMLFRVVLHKPK